MRRIPALLLLLLLAPACSSSKQSPPPAEPTRKNTAETRMRVERVSVEPSAPPKVLFELSRPAVLPDRLKGEFNGGRSWLQIRDPRRYSFAAGDLLVGKTLFRPLKASMTFAQENRSSSVPRQEPVLVRFEGSVDRDALAPFLESVPDPEITPEGLGAIEHQDLRVMLGRGVDLLMSTLGSTKLDIHVWVAVVDEAGARQKWRDLLVDAYQARSVEKLAPYRVLVMRRRPGALPRYFRLRFDHVVLAAQMVLQPRGTKMDWIWEGVWFGRMEAAPQKIHAPEWPDLPLPELVYKEYRRPKGSLSGFWPALMKPLALGADVGTAFIEGEPVFDSYAKKAVGRRP